MRQANGLAERNGSKGKNTVIRLSEARDITPPVNPVEAVKQSLVMSLYGRIGDEDVEQLVESIKKQALEGDHRCRKLILDLVTKTMGSSAGKGERVVEKTVIVEPGARQLRLLCAYAIASNGPMGLSALATLVGMAEEDAAKLLDGCWFDSNSRGYSLSQEGKQQVQ